MGLTPRSRAEQRQIAQLLEAADEDGSEELDFGAFCCFFQKVQERLSSMQRKEELRDAHELDISTAQLEEYRSAFEMLDVEETGQLGLDAVRRMMDMLRIPISGDALNELFNEIDEDDSGLVEFSEFLKLIPMVEAHVEKYGRLAMKVKQFHRPSKDKPSSKTKEKEADVLSR